MLRIENLKVGALPPLTFQVAGGECLAVEGPSGCGKSRLLRAIADLDPAEGSVYLDGAERREMPGSQWRRLVRYAAAEPAWWTDSAAAALPADTPRTAKMVSDLGLDPGIVERPLSQLSTGERQRLAIVRALADQPRVLLLDEPTGALDTASAALAEELIRYQVLAGRSVILVSHDAAQIGRLAEVRLQLARALPAEGSDASSPPPGASPSGAAP